MKFCSFLILTLFWVSFAKADPSWYTGKGSTQALLNFETTVEFTPRGAPTAEFVRQAIEAQILHLFGTLEDAKIPAVPKLDHRITHVKLSKLPDGSYSARYRFSGTIVVRSGPRTRYDLILPIRPGKIYREALVERSGYLVNPCTDPDYNTEDDFWYFWNPNYPGCRLQEGKHYHRIRGAIERLPNTRLTYPEYSRLVDEKGVVRVDVFFGMNDSTRSKNPRRSQDENGYAFRAFRSQMLAMGFTETVLTKAQVSRIIGRQVNPIPFLSTYLWQGKNASIAVRVFFGATGRDERSHGFHRILSDAFRRSSIVIYDGHSGLGDTLDLSAIEAQRRMRFSFDPNKYQIFFFNSCTSYPYYQRDFFGRKRSSSDPRGTKNLDILTQGLSTPFEYSASANVAIVRAVQRWAAGYRPPSYQRLADIIDGGTLFGVNGDEDNPTSP